MSSRSKRLDVASGRTPQLCQKAWPWLKRNWKWVLLPVGILLAALQFLPRRRQLQATSELADAAETKRKADEKFQEAVVEAEARKKEELEAIEQEHEETIRVLTDEQKGKVEELREDPEQLNAFLKGVGKKVR